MSCNEVSSVDGPETTVAAAAEAAAASGASPDATETSTSTEAAAAVAKASSSCDLPSVDRRRTHKTLRQPPPYVMERSPYEIRHKAFTHRTAEHGEPLFHRLKGMVDPVGAKEDEFDDDSSSSNESSEPEDYDEDDPFVHPDLMELMGGEEKALLFVQSYHYIDKRAMAFSSSWVKEDAMGRKRAGAAENSVSATARTGRSRSRGDGTSQENLVRTLPKYLLLLCLQPERIGRTSEATLKEIIAELDLFKILLRALDEWNLKSRFRQIATAAELNDALVFPKLKGACYKCIIFLARAISVLQLFDNAGWRTLDQSLKSTTLWDKIWTSLKIIDENVQIPPQKLEVWKQMQQEKATESDGADASSARTSSSSSSSSSPKSPESVEEQDGQAQHQLAPDNRKRLAEVSESTASHSTADAATRSMLFRTKQTRRGSSESSSKTLSSNRLAPQCPPFEVPRSLGAQLQLQHARLGEEVVKLIPCQDLQRKHESLGKAIATLRAQIEEDPEQMRAQMREEIRQELLREMEAEATNSSSSSKDSNKKQKRVCST
jgi:hypothetical protein